MTGKPEVTSLSGPFLGKGNDVADGQRYRVIITSETESLARNCR